MILKIAKSVQNNGLSLTLRMFCRKVLNKFYSFSLLQVDLISMLIAPRGYWVFLK